MSRYVLKFGLLILDDDMTDEDDPFYDDKVSKRLINGSSSKEKARVSFMLRFSKRTLRNIPVSFLSFQLSRNF